MDYCGKRASFITLGCKLNFSETSSIAHSLEESGFQRVDFDEKADLCFINTCTVTSAGDKSSRNLLRRAIRNNPDAIIVAAGCYAQLKPEELARIHGIDFILGSHEKFLLPEYLGNLEKKEKPFICNSGLWQQPTFHGSLSKNERTRCFLKIQDGCDYYCSYCTVPFARGKSRSGPVETLVKEARKAIGEGYREIILSGVNIGDFGKERNESLADLLSALTKVDGLSRLRLGSVEPNLLTDEIIEMAAGSAILMPHFHIPLQSGSDEILALMKRRYTTELFASRIEKIRKTLPMAFIGVDVIAGTNGETEKHFLESYNFINGLEISQLHAFPYSERNGTEALKIPLNVPVEVRKTRTRQYINLSDKKLHAFHEKNLGTFQHVLFEKKSGKERMEGLTTNYIRVESPFVEDFLNRNIPVKITGLLPDGKMQAEFL